MDVTSSYSEQKFSSLDSTNPTHDEEPISHLQQTIHAHICSTVLICEPSFFYSAMNEIKKERERDTYIMQRNSSVIKLTR